MKKQKIEYITAILIGAGSRGKDAYGSYAVKHPDRLKFIAVADPNKEKIKMFQEDHNISDQYAFTSWEKLLSDKKGRIADVAFVCTPDRQHYEPAMKAIKLGYDVVLEKPIAPILEECQNIAQLAEKEKRFVQICHVLRYTEFWKVIKKTLESGTLGKIIHYDQSENVAFWHFGHSFVPGAYKNKETSTAIVLAKTCHDLDLMYWLLDEKAIDVHSVGEVTHYKPENAPEGAPKRCTDGCPHEKDCPWFAPRLYIDLEPLIRIGKYAPSPIVRFFSKRMVKSKALQTFFGLFNKKIRKIKNWDQFPISAITTDYSIEGRMKALEDGPYGLCIYNTGNDVPDHQISTFTFPSGATATLTMHGLSEHEGRELRIFGSKGVLRGVFRNNIELIEFTDFRYGDTVVLHKKGLSTKGHGGGDWALMKAFTAVKLGEMNSEKENLTNISSAMESHFMGFAAEESRLSGKVVKIDDFRYSKK